MTEQETFDIVVSALIKQGRPSINREGCCKYRSDDGRKCAVGHLIPDDRYDFSMEGKLCNSDWISNILNEQGHDIELCRDLQIAHDKPYAWATDWVKAFTSRAKDVAEKHNLEWNHD